MSSKEKNRAPASLFWSKERGGLYVNLILNEREIRDVAFDLLAHGEPG